MQYESTLQMNYKVQLANILSWVFGITVFAIGILNILWGNDHAFGAFLMMLSFIYFPPANVMLHEITRFSIPVVLKILLGVGIVVAVLGVGELFGKIQLMLNDL